MFKMIESFERTKLEIIKKLMSQINVNKLEELYRKYYDSRVKPNGFLGEIPLVVINTSYSQDNEVTGYKSYLKDNFSENMFINNYSLQVEAVLSGIYWKKDLEKIVEQSRQRDYTIFMYKKLDNKIYTPVVISSFSYSEDYTNNTMIKISFTLKEIKLLKFIKGEDGKTTTGVYTPSSTIQDKELKVQTMPDNMFNKYQDDVRMEGINAV